MRSGGGCGFGVVTGGGGVKGGMAESSGLEKEDTKLKKAAFRLLGGNTVARSGFEIRYIIILYKQLLRPRNSPSKESVRGS